MTLTAGSLFSGYGGLDLAVEALLDVEVIWHSEIDPSASLVLARRWPDAPNLGDITTLDWTDVEPVDIITGGFPCQDISSAGRGAGIKEGTRSGLWHRYADAVRVLRPRLVIVENVAALIFRGIDIVVGDLAEIGYDARWTSVRAADVGAPHRRERIFLVAWPADTDSGDQSARGAAPAADTDDTTDDRERARSEPGQRSETAAADTDDIGHERTWGARDGRHGPANDGATPTDPDGERLEGTESQRVRVGKLAGSGDDSRAATNTERGRVDPDGRVRRGTTPSRRATRQAGEPAGQAVALTADPVEDRASTDTDPDDERRERTVTESLGYDSRNDTRPAADTDSGRRDGSEESVVDWGAYRPAIDRWATITERPAPDPVDDRGRLDPRFVEWMMGLPAGWVTDLLPAEITRANALRMLGNGVVPLQALAALTWLLDT